jgi:hypothetical protein
VSATENLLKLYAAYRACGDDAPEKLDLLEKYEESLAAACRDDFNGQMAPECVRNWIHSKGMAGEHSKLPRTD